MPSDPLPHRLVVIGLAESGRTVTVWAGQRVTVRLAPNWSPPQPDATGRSLTAATPPPLRTDSAQGYPGPDVGEATFTALREGTAVITAHTDYSCLHITPRCALPSQSFTVTVRVLSPAGTGPGNA